MSLTFSKWSDHRHQALWLHGHAADSHTSLWMGGGGGARLAWHRGCPCPAPMLTRQKRARRLWPGEEGCRQHAGDGVRDAAVRGARGHPGGDSKRSLGWSADLLAGCSELESANVQKTIIMCMFCFTMAVFLRAFALSGLDQHIVHVRFLSTKRTLVSHAPHACRPVRRWVLQCTQAWACWAGHAGAHLRAGGGPVERRHCALHPAGRCASYLQISPGTLPNPRSEVHVGAGNSMAQNHSLGAEARVLCLEAVTHALRSAFGAWQVQCCLLQLYFTGPRAQGTRRSMMRMSLRSLRRSGQGSTPLTTLCGTWYQTGGPPRSLGRAPCAHAF
jgi:hypothetical protein